jgi:hypothetical protein
MKLRKKYQVQERYRPADAWITIAAFRSFAKATKYAERHYLNKTEDDPENPCPCKSCTSGWKAIDWMTFDVRTTTKKEATK